MRSALSLTILTVFDVASTAAVNLKPRIVNEDDYLYFGVALKYTANAKVTTTVDIGSAYRQPSYQAVLDTSSANFWTWKDYATLHWGSDIPDVEGTCNKSIHKLYQYTPINSRSSLVTDQNTTYLGVGNTEVVSGIEVATDTISFIWGQDYTNLDSIDFGLENYGLVAQADDASCASPPSYDEITIGLSQYTNTTIGPSFRQGLFNRATISSKVMTMWFDDNAGALSAFSGGVTFGGIDTSKFNGSLVRVATAVLEGKEGIYVKKPKFSVAGKKFKLDDTSVETCSINSASATDTLPFLASGAGKSAFLAATGLVEYNGILAYKGACASIPTTSTLTYRFQGSNCNETVTIKVPLRNYARGLTSTRSEAAGLCLLNLNLGGECVLGAPFLSAAFLALDDSDGSVALAQGGVSVKGSALNIATFKVLEASEKF